MAPDRSEPDVDEPISDEELERLALAVWGTTDRNLQNIYQGHVDLKAPFRRITMRQLVKNELPDAPVEER